MLCSLLFSDPCLSILSNPCYLLFGTFLAFLSYQGCRRYYYCCMSKWVIKPIEWCSNRLLFPVHAVLVALKFCPVRKCTITYTAFVKRFFSLLINLFLRFSFHCHASIDILFDINGSIILNLVFLRIYDNNSHKDTYGRIKVRSKK